MSEEFVWYYLNLNDTRHETEITSDKKECSTNVYRLQSELSQSIICSHGVSIIVLYISSPIATAVASTTGIMMTAPTLANCK
jgi:hypothetical protein